MEDRRLLPRRYKALIGEIIMIGAEIDQIIISALTRITGLQIQDAMVLLSRNSVSSNFKSLRYLVDAAGLIDLGNKLDDLEARLFKFSRARNTFAHGALIGRVDDEIHFSVLSDYTSDFNDGTFANRVSIYDENTLKKYVEIGEKIVTDVRQYFQVKMLHEVPSVGSHEGRPPSPRELRKNSRTAQPHPPRSPLE